MINRIERPLANDHPDGSLSVHLFLHRPKTQISRIIGQYTHNLLGLKTLSFALLLIIHKIWIKGPQIGSDMPSALGLVMLGLSKFKILKLNSSARSVIGWGGHNNQSAVTNASRVLKLKAVKLEWNKTQACNVFQVKTNIHIF